MKRVALAIILLISVTLAMAQVYPVYDSTAAKWVDSTGQARRFQIVNRMPRISSTDYYQSIAEGDVAGHTGIRDIGYNPAVGTAEECLWFTSTPPNWPAAAQQMACSSSSASDAGAGSGVRRIKIEYLDASFVQHMDSVVLNGVTRVLTNATNIYRINDLWTDSAGTGKAAAGNISVYKTTGDTIYRQIAQGRNRTQALLYTVPATKTFYMTDWEASSWSSVAQPNGTEFRIRATLSPDGKNTQVARLFYHHGALVVTQGAEHVVYPIPHPYPEKVDLYMGVLSTGGTNTCQGGWAGWIE